MDLEVLDQANRWAASGAKVAIATVTSAKRSVPRPPGSQFAVSDRGQVAGSVSGGCVESDVAAVAEAVLADGVPRLVEYGIPDEDAFAVGLTCGGTIEVLVEAL